MGRLCHLTTLEPEGLSHVSGTDPNWETVEFAVDSGASETVIPEGLCTSVPTRPSDASRRGVQYEVANGERIPNLGSQRLEGLTDGEGLVRNLTAQVCGVNKALLSVHKLNEAGHTVVFQPGAAHIVDGTTGERIWLREHQGMYMLKLWMPRTSSSAGF